MSEYVTEEFCFLTREMLITELEQRTKDKNLDVGSLIRFFLVFSLLAIIYTLAELSKEQSNLKRRLLKDINICQLKTSLLSSERTSEMNL